MTLHRFFLSRFPEYFGYKMTKYTTNTVTIVVNRSQRSESFIDCNDYSLFSVYKIQITIHTHIYIYIIPSQLSTHNSGIVK